MDHVVVRLPCSSKLYILACMTLILCSCATGDGPLFSPSAIGSAAGPQLFIYRQKSVYQHWTKFEFLIDRRMVITLGDGNYAQIRLTPGTHEIIAGGLDYLEQPPIRLCIEMVKGKNMYVRYGMHTNLLISLLDRPKINNRFEVVEESVALTELIEMRLTIVP
jgi:hypothetical protein